MNVRPAVWSNWDGAMNDAIRAAKWTGRRWRVRRLAVGAPGAAWGGWLSEPVSPPFTYSLVRSR